MKTFILLCLGFLTLGAFAQTKEEEAIILNQELQFLEDSVNNVQAAALNTKAPKESETNKILNEPSLERTYFGEDLSEDVVSTRSAGQKRRRLTE
jgi:hypothetical protein